VTVNTVGIDGEQRGLSLLALLRRIKTWHGRFSMIHRDLPGANQCDGLLVDLVLPLDHILKLEDLSGFGAPNLNLGYLIETFH